MLHAARLSTAAVVSAALLSASLTTAALAETEWDLPLAWPDGNFHVENAKTFAKVVGQVTGGEVTINIHPGGSLGFKGPEMLNAVGDGLVPIGEMLLNQQVGERKILGLETQPYLIEDLDQLAVFHEHFRPAIERVAAEYNQRVLYVVPWPRQYVYTKVEAKGVADLAGIKIRTYNRTTHRDVQPHRHDLGAASLGRGGAVARGRYHRCGHDLGELRGGWEVLGIPHAHVPARATSGCRTWSP